MKNESVMSNLLILFQKGIHSLDLYHTAYILLNYDEENKMIKLLVKRFQKF